MSTTMPIVLSAVPVLDGWRVGRTIKLGGWGREILADGFLWVVNEKGREFTGDLPDGEIYKVDPATMKVAATVPHAIGGYPAVGEGAIWLINAESGQTVTRVDLETLEVERFRTSTSADPVPEAVALAGGAVWVGNNHDGTVAKIDPSTLEVEKTIVLTEPGEWGVRGQAATNGSSVWFGITRTGEIVRIDVASGEEVSRLTLPIVPHDELPDGLDQAHSSPPEFMSVIGDELWVRTVDHIYAIDIRTVGQEHIVGDIATRGPWDTELVVDDAGSIWTLAFEPNEMVKIDPHSMAAVGRFPVDTDLDGYNRFVVDGDRMYVRAEDKVVELRRD